MNRFIKCYSTAHKITYNHTRQEADNVCVLLLVKSLPLSGGKNQQGRHLIVPSRHSESAHIKHAICEGFTGLQINHHVNA